MLAEARRLRVRFLGQALGDWDDADVGTFAALIERFNASVRDAGAAGHLAVGGSDDSGTG